jgi:arylsulfatase A-like enzyme
MCAESLKLTSHYAGSTVCAPSRYTLLTGRHIGHAPAIGQQQQLTAADPTFAKTLKAAGYRTACIGKWGLGERTGHPNRQGFDHFFGFLSQGRAHFYYPDYVWRNGEKLVLKDNPKTHEHYVHDLFTDEALAFIDKSREQPFLLYLPYTIPHAEVLVPEDSQEPYIGKLGDPERGPIEKPYVMKGYNKPRYPRAARAGMISRLDRDVGRIRTRLEKLGIDRKTLIIFTSDNGPCPAGGQDVRFFDSSGPLKGMKRSLYEGGIRVPTIAWWPGTIEPGTTSDHASAFWDYLPTFAELAGVKPRKPTDGVSIAPTLSGHPEQQKAHEYLFWDYGERGVTSKISAVRRGNWKAVIDRKAGTPVELYDLSKDLGEKHNVAGERPEIAAELLAIMKEYWR